MIYFVSWRILQTNSKRNGKTEEREEQKEESFGYKSKGYENNPDQESSKISEY